MKIRKQFYIILLLVLSYHFGVFAAHPAHLNISSGAYCKLWGNIAMTLSGNLNNSGTFNATGTSTVIFSGSTLEAIGGTGVTQFQNALLNNPSNAYLTGAISVDDTLKLMTGYLNIKSYDLTLGGSATIVGSFGNTNGPFGTSTMIVADATGGSAGQLKKTFPVISGSAISIVFPIGDTTMPASNYSPVTLSLLTNNTQRTLGVNVANLPDMNGTLPSAYLNRYWSFTDNTNTTGNYSYDATFTYSTDLPTDLVGSYNALCMSYWNGGAWINLPTGFPGAPSYTVTGADQTTGPFGNNQFTARQCACNAPTFSQQPVVSPTPQCNPVSTGFTVAASGDGTISYQWQVNNGSWNNIPDGGSNPSYSGTNSNKLTIKGNTSTLQYRCLASNCSGANITPSNTVTLNINTPPVITFITSPKIKCSRDSVMFNVIVAGTSPSYQWAFKGSNISNATKNSYIIGNITPIDTGRYYCYVSNVCGNTSAYTSLKMNLTPYIADTIQNLTKCEGTAVSFTVIATGGNLIYQWTKSGTNIPGATSTIFSIVNLTSGDGNVYSCIVSNTCGTKNMKPFLLSINKKPSVNIVPITLTKNPGDSIYFSLSPSGLLPFGYQWKHYTNNIVGSTQNSFDIKSLVCKDAGVYSSVISNACGSTTAMIATIIINNCTRDSISGKVTYDNVTKTPITNTVVYLEDAQSQKIDSSITDKTGEYIFHNLNNGTYKLVCGYTPMTWGGSNPVDALTVDRYFVKLIKAFGGDNTLRKLAADVDNNTSINPVDALKINQRFVKLIKKFTIPNWLFDSPTVTVSDSPIFQDIKAICAGDVNGSYPK